MFVINANASGSASATAYATGSGGNTSVTSLSGYYDIPMNGSTYNMFNCRTENECNGGYNHNTCTYTGWDGNNPNESSVLSYGKASSFDIDVLYPTNMTSVGGYGPFCGCIVYCNMKNIPFGTHTLDQIVEVDKGEIPGFNYSTIVSRKKFSGGEKIGRTITTYIEAKTDDYDGTPFFYGINGCSERGLTHYALKCPFTYYFDLGLMHSDGTKTVIQKKEYTYPYYKMENDLSCTKMGGNLCLDGNPKIHVFDGESTNEPVVACPGDRLYFEKGTCPICLLYDVHTTTKSCEACSQLYGCVTGKTCYFIMTSKGNTDVRTNCAVALCHCCDDYRFKGIQFSIE